MTQNPHHFPADILVLISFDRLENLVFLVSFTTKWQIVKFLGDPGAGAAP